MIVASVPYIRLLVLSHDGEQVLCNPAKDLPELSLAGLRLQSHGPLISLAQQTWGLDLFVLRYLNFSEDPGDGHLLQGTCLAYCPAPATPLDDVSAPMGDASAPKGDVSWQPLSVLEEKQASLGLPQDWKTLATSGSGPDWRRIGWLSKIGQWIDGALSEQNITRTGSLVLVRSWSLSVVLALPTTAGRLFFKEYVKLPEERYADEGCLTQTLAKRFPKAVIPVLVRDQQRMITRDLGPAFRDQTAENLLERAVMALGTLQLEIASQSQPDDLLSTRDMNQVAEDIRAMVGDPEIRALLEPDRLGRLERVLPQIVERCAALGREVVPLSLVHGDFHLGNVAGGGDPVIFDWSDGCLAHPFLDMISVYDMVDVEKRRALRNKYLSLWTDYAPLPDLVWIWELARPLAYLYQAASCRHLLAAMAPEDRGELIGDPRYLMTRFLSGLDSSGHIS